MKRCYSKDSYDDCSVCDDWVYFTKFKAWMEQQEWEGKELDKDLMLGSLMMYSPETCTFVDKGVNSFLLVRGNSRGVHPVGVCYDKSRALYQSHCNVIFNGVRKRKNLGRFNDPTLAHKAWQEAKLNQAKLLQSKQTCSRTKAGLQRVIDKLTQHIEQGVETKSL